MLPLLLVPGLACTAEVFAPQIASLWPRGPVTVANTRVGQSIAAMAAAILADAPPRFALGGISMGGYIAFDMLRQAPERIARLALIDTSARPDRPEQAAIRRERVASIRAGRVFEASEAAFAGLVHPRHAADRALLALTVRMTLAIGVEAYANQQEAIIARPDSRPTLGQVRVPTVVIVGAADQLTPPDLAREMAEGIAGAELVVIPDAGHLSPVENPAAVNDALGRWLEA